MSVPFWQLPKQFVISRVGFQKTLPLQITRVFTNAINID